MAKGKASNTIGQALMVGLVLASGLFYTVGRSNQEQASSNEFILTATAYVRRLQSTQAASIANIQTTDNRLAQQITQAAPTNTPTNAITLAPPTIDPAMAATGEMIRSLLTATALSREAAAVAIVPTNTALPSATEPVTMTPLPTFTHTATIAPTATASFTAVPPSTTPTFTAIPPTAQPTALPSDTLTWTPIPPTATFTAVLPTTASEGLTHTVLAGETLYRVALQYNTTVEELVATNGLPNFQIRVGQTLFIPNAASPITPTSVALASSSQATSTQTRIETASPTVTPLPTATPLAPQQVNGLGYDQIVAMSPDVIANIRAIYARGQALGRNPNAFTRLGDSTIEPPHFLKRFDDGFYHLGDYGHLQGVINHYGGSFTHNSVAVRRGMHSWAVFDPLWASYGVCNPGEHVLDCELRRHNPSVIIVRLGSNDRGVPDSVQRNLSRAIEYLIDNGVIPIMGTKADRFEGPSDINNQIIRQIASDYQLPLWDFDLVSTTIPGRGLGPDNVHLNFFFAHDWRQPQGFSTGHGMQNLTALIALSAVWQVLESPSA